MKIFNITHSFLLLVSYLLKRSKIIVIILIFSLYIIGCGKDPVEITGGQERVVMQDEKSALYGTNETIGIFDITVSSSGISFSSVSNISIIGISGNTSNITITNQSNSDLKGVVMRAGSLDSNVSLNNSDGGNFHNFGDISSGQSVSKAVTFTGTGTGRIYITQRKETVTTGVLEQGLAKSISSKPTFSDSWMDKPQPYSSDVRQAVTTGAISQGASTSVKVDSAGNPKVSYFQVDNYDLKYAYWDGAAWQTVIVDSTGKTGYYSSLALTSLGNPRISYYYSEDSSGAVTGDLRYAYCNANCNDNANWGMVTIDSTGDVGGYTSITLNSSGNPRIAYYDFTNMDLKYAYCDSACENSANWIKVTVDSAGYVGSYASLALDSAGNPRISYYDYSNGDLKYAYCSSGCNSSANWTLVTVDNTNDVGGYTSIAINSSGNPRISYFDFTNLDLRYSYCDLNCNLTASWTKVTVDGTNINYISPTYGQNWTYNRHMGAFSFLSLDNSGNPHITYYYSNYFYNTTTIEIISKGYLMHASCLSACSSSANWGTNIIDATTDTGWFSSIGITNSNTAYITYYSAANKNLYIISLNASMPTNGSIETGSYSGQFNSIKTDSNGYPHISYAVNNSDGSKNLNVVKYVFWNGSMWKIVTIDSGPVQVNGWQPQTSLALTSTYKPRILYTWDRDFLKYAYCDSGCDITANWTIVSLNVNSYLPTLNLPNPFNLSSQQLSNYIVGAPPDVIQLPSGKYRVYYTDNVAGTYIRLVYRDTIDTNPPNLTNLGASQLLNVGTSSTDNASGIKVIKLPAPSPEYRIYYNYGTSIWNWTIAYRDTNDGNPPSGTNLGARQDIALVPAIANYFPLNLEVVQLSSGKYRVYYNYYSSYWQICYKDTTDTNPPNIANLGAQQVLFGSSTEQPQSPRVLQLPSGKYRLYFSYFSTYPWGNTTVSIWRLGYRDTTDANHPNSTNLGTTLPLFIDATIGFYSARGAGILQFPSGLYRLYYSMETQNNPYLAYKDASDNGSQTVFGPSLALDSTDNPRISYWNNSSLQYSYCDTNCNLTASWTAVVIDNSIGNYSDSSTQTSLALNTSNNPRIAYYDATNADLKYAYCDSGCNVSGNWTTLTVASSDDSGRYASLALNLSNNPRIAYSRFHSSSIVMNYTYCDANCNLPANWTTGLTVSSSLKVGNNPLALDVNGKSRVNLINFYSIYNNIYYVPYNAPYYSSCSSGCNTSANWTFTQQNHYVSNWTSLSINSSNLFQSAFYKYTTDGYGNAGLYYRWDYNPP